MKTNRGKAGDLGLGDFLKRGGWQAFVPGWNIVYMLGERSKFERGLFEREVRAGHERTQFGFNMLVLGGQRKEAEKRGDRQAVDDLDERAIDNIKSYLGR